MLERKGGRVWLPEKSIHFFCIILDDIVRHWGQGTVSNAFAMLVKILCLSYSLWFAFGVMDAVEKHKAVQLMRDAPWLVFFRL